MKSNIRTLFILLTVFGFLTSCSVGPKYERPAIEIPDEYKEIKGWKTAQPRDNEIRGKWWKMFNDPLLDQLLDQVNISNQNLAQAEAQFRLAHALVQSARSGYFPNILANFSSTRSQSPQISGNGGTAPANMHSISLDTSWEPDLWGRVNRTVESNFAAEQASLDDLESLRLSVQASLVQDYFMLRILDTQKQLLEETVAGYEKSLELTKNRYAAGVVGKVDVVQAETQLRSTQAQAMDLGIQRAQLEHAIALLAGKAASTFTILTQTITTIPPATPVGIPSELLERRPDISAAERRVAAANAQIGVAKSAFFPTLTLSGGLGYQTSMIAQLLTAPSEFWYVGGAIAQNLFDGGIRQAAVNQMEAAFDANVAAYRQTVLGAFQEVEDNLAALRILEKEAEIENEAVKAARQSVELLLNQYKAGTVNFLDVVTAQATALINERAAINVLGQRLTATVSLVKALGGSWNKDISASY
ncbi:MAG: efflux transporter outer membrane subunit [Nitrospiria bacterium]